MKNVTVCTPGYGYPCQVPETLEEALVILKEHDLHSRGMAMLWLEEHAVEDERIFRIYVLKKLRDLAWKVSKR